MWVYCHVNVLVRRPISLHIPIFYCNYNVNYLILSYLILSYLILSYLILSYLILSYLILSYLILSYLILSYLILSYLILSYLILYNYYQNIPYRFCLVSSVGNYNCHQSLESHSCVLSVISSSRALTIIAEIHYVLDDVIHVRDDVNANDGDVTS